MTKSCKGILEILGNLDLFGKEVDLYYRGKQKKASTFGIIYSIIYIGIYITFFLFLLVKMYKRENITFYESIAYNDEVPKMTLTPDIFYMGFALLNTESLQIVSDDSIFNVVAYHITIRGGNYAGYEMCFLEVENCEIEKFAENYRNLFKDKVGSFRCIKTLDIMSFVRLEFYPCSNSSLNNNHCKPIKDIKDTLSKSYLNFIMEDIDLTPQKYNDPVTPTKREEFSADLSTTLVQEIELYFQIVNIETDQDLIGLEFTPNIRTEKFLKYDQIIIKYTANPEENFGNNYVCTASLNLSLKEMSQKRTYRKLFEILGDIGGVMEIVFSFFKAISFLLTETLYETSFVNNLFSFDLDRKVIIIKDNKSIDNMDDSYTMYKQFPHISNRNKNNLDIGKSTKKMIDVSNANSVKLKSQIKNLYPRPKIKIIKKKKKINKSSYSSANYIEISKNPSSLGSVVNKINCARNEDPSFQCFKYKNNNVATYNKKNTITEGAKRAIINKIRLNAFCLYFCFCCVRNKKNIQNIMLDEGMELIKSNLDIINIFRKLYTIDNIEENNKTTEKILGMSEKCKNDILYMRKLAENKYYLG